MTKEFIGVVPFWPLRTLASENYFLQPALFARKQGYRASIFIFSSGTESKETSCAGIPLRFFSSLFSLYRSLPLNAIIHCQTSCRSIFLILFLLFLRQKNCRVVWTPHTSFGKGHPSNLPLNFFKIFSFVFRRLDRIVTITKYEEEYLRNLSYKNVFYLPLVIDSRRFECIKPLGSRRSFRLLFIGGDRPVKGLTGVLQAVSVLKRLKVNVELTVLGEVSLTFVKKYADLISSKVKFLGRVKSSSVLLSDTFRKSDCFVNNSFYEGPALAVNEAAAAGLFLCLSDLPTLKGTFGETASYHEPNNYSRLVRSVLFYFYNPEVAEKQAIKNRKIAEDFSYSNFEVKFSQLLQSLER